MSGRKFNDKPRANSKSDTRHASTGVQKVDWKGYVNFDLTAEHKALFQKLSQEGRWFVSELADDMAEGYSLKVRYDNRNQAYSATLFCEDAKHKHGGWALVARASDPISAQERVAFIHTVILERDWQVGESSPSWTDDKW